MYLHNYFPILHPVMETERIDVVIFGATGFTGKCVVQELIKFKNLPNLSWGIAGRNEQKLREVLDWASLRTGSFADWMCLIYSLIFSGSSSDYDNV